MRRLSAAGVIVGAVLMLVGILMTKGLEHALIMGGITLMVLGLFVPMLFTIYRGFEEE